MKFGCADKKAIYTTCGRFAFLTLSLPIHTRSRLPQESTHFMGSRLFLFEESATESNTCRVFILAACLHIKVIGTLPYAILSLL